MLQGRMEQTRLLIVSLLLLTTMMFTMMSTHGVLAGDGGSPSHDMVYYGECWDPNYPPNGLWATLYEHVNWKCTDGSGTTHDFTTVRTLESRVCAEDILSSSGYSADGWRMDVTNYTSATVFNAPGQQVYP
jgi:hypothetical protein